MKPSNLLYKKGDLFDAELEQGALNLLLHACNCQGMWGSGVAKQFAEKFPSTYDDYRMICRGVNPIGESWILGEGTDNPRVVAAFTSTNYGKLVDPVDIILLNTKSALADLEDKLTFEPNVSIHSPKINAGLFKTPWEETEKLIIDFLSVRPDIVWTVWELE